MFCLALFDESLICNHAWTVERERETRRGRKGEREREGGGGGGGGKKERESERKRESKGLTFMSLPSISCVLIQKSIPRVGMPVYANFPSLYCIRMLVFPTPESPIMIMLNR